MLTPYPDGAAGTRLQSGLILSGDDAPAFERAGFPTLRVEVLCSARIAAGEQPLPRSPILAAIDCNGATAHALSWVLDGAGATVRAVALAHGIYAGERTRSVVTWLDPDEIIGAHEALTDWLPGFGCFAVLRPLGPRGRAIMHAETCLV